MKKLPIFAQLVVSVSRAFLFLILAFSAPPLFFQTPLTKYTDMLYQGVSSNKNESCQWRRRWPRDSCSSIHDQPSAMTEHWPKEKREHWPLQPNIKPSHFWWGKSEHGHFSRRWTPYVVIPILSWLNCAFLKLIRHLACVVCYWAKVNS